MKDKKKPPLIIEDIDELAENEEYLTANADIELLVFAVEEDEVPAFGWLMIKYFILFLLRE